MNRPPLPTRPGPGAGPDFEPPPHIRGLIFDFDGTLADTMPLHWEVWRDLAARHGFHFTRQRLHQLAGIPTREILRTLAREQGLALEIEAIAREKEAAYLARVPEVQPIEPLVRLARAQRGRCRLAVASGGSRRVIPRVLDHLGLTDLFDAVVTQDDVAHPKPAPDLFLEAARRLGLAPGECQAFEDGEPGLAAIRAAGREAVDVRQWPGLSAA